MKKDLHLRQITTKAGRGYLLSIDDLGIIKVTRSEYVEMGEPSEGDILELNLKKKT